MLNIFLFFVVNSSFIEYILSNDKRQTASIRTLNERSFAGILAYDRPEGGVSE